jgi:hypothetical protein
VTLLGRSPPRSALRASARLGAVGWAGAAVLLAGIALLARASWHQRALVARDA